MRTMLKGSVIMPVWDCGAEIMRWKCYRRGLLGDQADRGAGLSVYVSADPAGSAAGVRPGDFLLAGQPFVPGDLLTIKTIPTGEMFITGRYGMEAAPSQSTGNSSSATRLSSGFSGLSFPEDAGVYHGLQKQETQPLLLYHGEASEKLQGRTARS